MRAGLVSRLPPSVPLVHHGANKKTGHDAVAGQAPIAIVHHPSMHYRTRANITVLSGFTPARRRAFSSLQGIRYTPAISVAHTSDR